MRTILVWALIGVTAAPAPACAAMIPTQRQQDVQQVQIALENKVLRARLVEVGLTPAEIDRSMARLSDRQVHELAQQAAYINPGGDGGFDTVVAIGAIAVLVLLLVYLIKRLNARK